MNKIKNAKIESATIGFEGHGLLTIYINLDYGGTGQGIGGYNLSSGDYLCKWVKGLLNTFQLENWAELKGQNIRAEIGEDGKIKRIGHYLEDNWFDPSEIK